MKKRSKRDAMSEVAKDLRRISKNTLSQQQAVDRVKRANRLADKQNNR